MTSIDTINLSNKKILLGVTGGIAIYKAVELVRLLKKDGAEVRVIMTKSAREFIQPLTFATVSNNMVHTEMFDQHHEKNIEHIELAKWADVILLAPATANIIAKLTYGIADDLLSTVCLAATAPICIVPAMNKEMWSKEITQINISCLIKRGAKIFAPSEGVQACGDIGCGRMMEPKEILALVHKNFAPKIFVNKKIVITAGPTIEPIDPVRYISNYSSGKMGYAIAEAFSEAGANVTLISGPTHLSAPSNIKIINVETAAEMLTKVMVEIVDCAIFISVAAVCDYSVTPVSEQKIKKEKNFLELKLQKNPDILTEVAALPNRPFIVGFAAETENLLENAQKKLYAKNIDMIAANLVGKNRGFNQDVNTLTLVTKNGIKLELSEKSKASLAHDLVQFIFENYQK